MSCSRTFPDARPAAGRLPALGAWRPAALVLLLALALPACYRGRPDQARGPAGAGGGPRTRGVPVGTLDPTVTYAQAGLLAEADPLPFVGAIRHFAGATADTTLTLVALSLANRALTFTNEGDGYRAAYQVTIDVRQGATVTKHLEARETVRVASFRETSRSDESIIFQQWVALPPGQYVFAVAVRDAGSARTNDHEILIQIPRLTTTGTAATGAALAGDSARVLASPIPVYEADPRVRTDTLPRLVANPRATFVFGRDSLGKVYLEAYGAAAGTYVVLSAVGSQGVALWTDTARLARSGSLAAGTVEVPVARLGVGRLTLAAAVPGSADTVRTPIFVTFGEEWAIGSFEEMLQLLRYFASERRLRVLRDTTAEARAAVWMQFWRETDPDPATPEHEALRDYFARIQAANNQFREEGVPGWLTDRGRVYVTLGDPDQRMEQGEPSVSQRGRAQVWVYHQHNLQLVFIDQTGFGRWRLTTSSESEFESAAARERK